MVSEKHLGHYVYECFKKRPKDLCQVDAATGLSETNGSVLARSVRLGRSLIKYGLVPEKDIVALSGRGHLDLLIPYYAALFNGLPLLGVDVLYKLDEIKHILKLTAPKIAFCEPEAYDKYIQASLEIGLDIKIVTFGDGPNCMNAFIEQYPYSEPDEDFQPVSVDIDRSLIWLSSTSGSTSTFKVAAFTHRPWLNAVFEIIDMNVVYENIFDNSTASKPSLNLSPINWISGILNPIIAPLSNQYNVQTSAPVTSEHAIEIINKYKPVKAMLGPSILSYILKQSNKCDFTCFDLLTLGGAKVNPELLNEIRKRIRKGAMCFEMYGQTETIGPLFYPNPNTPIGSCGSPNTKVYKIKLIDPDTSKEVKEPNVKGELWTLGRRFECYYNDPEKTAESFSPDGWYKTGDIFYRDEHDNYYFVERSKRIIKYQSYHIAPGELENLIQSHPGVLDVSVTGIPHADDGEHAVACVVRKPGSDVTAQEIKDLVLSKLSEKKQLRGGVIFLDALPMTSNGKVMLAKLKEIALNSIKD
ncbi:unnamed protein product [Diatraea saccharalis]|uniref:Luciferin 4-monooxygenase n=1 Tax=Diatraea saccharalis TaxID=40085 RepID=A0A9P0CAT0_9NEOP|nr:unnamed protein product [Diatraea saccharalis]